VDRKDPAIAPLLHAVSVMSPSVEAACYDHFDGIAVIFKRKNMIGFNGN